MISAKVILDSETATKDRLTTVEVEMPKFLVAQLNTHRTFSRNSASSRAMPIMTVVHNVMDNPVVPATWPANGKGMQPKAELSGARRFLAKLVWSAHRYFSLLCAVAEDKIGLHKQLSNRLLETHMYTKVLISSTEWNNFFSLRVDNAAQEEMQLVARAVRSAIDTSIPEVLPHRHWHLPYVGQVPNTDPHLVEKIITSVSLCAQVSFRTLDDDYEKAKRVFHSLTSSSHLHASPMEHTVVAYDSSSRLGRSNMKCCFTQFRKVCEFIVKRKQELNVENIEKVVSSI